MRGNRNTGHLQGNETLTKAHTAPDSADLSEFVRLALSSPRHCRQHAKLSKLLQVQKLLQQMQGRFQTMSDSIISRVDEMGSKIDDLEKQIGDLVQQSGVEDRTHKHASKKQ